MNTTPTAPRQWLAGMALIGIGLVLLAIELLQPKDADWIVLGSLSILLFAFYAGTRQDGFLVPGAILGGLAIGLGLEDLGYGMNGGAVVLGLGAGFLAIYVIDNLFGAHPHWWPLIPGGILAVVGGAQAIGGTAAADAVARWWPAVLIVVGVLVLVAGQRQRSAPKPESGAKT